MRRSFDSHVRYKGSGTLTISKCLLKLLTKDILGMLKFFTCNITQKNVKCKNLTIVLTVRDVTWMSADGLHLCKWIIALIQVTLSHLKVCQFHREKGKRCPFPILVPLWHHFCIEHVWKKQCPFGKWHQNGAQKGTILRTINGCPKGTVLVPLVFFSEILTNCILSLHSEKKILVGHLLRRSSQ